MSDLTALQPTIFFATCTLKGIFWIPFTLLPEWFLSEPDENEEEEEEDLLLFFNNLDEQHLLQDHHVLFVERICHYTNIFLLVGMIAFYAVNPRLWQYRQYGWFLTALLVLQHIPQQLRHEGWWGVVEEDEFGLIPTLMEQVLETNKIFSTIGVTLVQGYCLYYGYWATLQRLAAEPFFVYGALMTLFIETHMTCVAVWTYKTSHLSTVLTYKTRILLCGCLMLLLGGLGIIHKQIHAQQEKQLRKQLKTIKKQGDPKLKFV